MGWFGWPPKDRPIFWITTAAFIAVSIYAWFTKCLTEKELGDFSML
jgi:hypothetical protein